MTLAFRKANSSARRDVLHAACGPHATTLGELVNARATAGAAVSLLVALFSAYRLSAQENSEQQSDAKIVAPVGVGTLQMTGDGDSIRNAHVNVGTLQMVGDGSRIEGIRVNVGILKMIGDGSPTFGERVSVRTLRMIGDGSPTLGARVSVGTLEMIGDGPPTLSINSVASATKRIRIGTLQMTGVEFPGAVGAPPGHVPTQQPNSLQTNPAPNAPRPSGRIIINRQ